MFDLLTRILLWLLIGTIVWYVFIRFIPRAYLTWLGGLIVFIFVVLAFVSPDNGTVAAVWSIFSLPLKPVGLVIFLLLSSLRAGTAKVAGNQVVAALLILFLCSMPIVAYWLAGQAERTVVNMRDIAIPDAQLRTARAIVVLSDGITPSNPSYRSRVQVGTLNGSFSFNNDLATRLLLVGETYQRQLERGIDSLVIVGAGPQVRSHDEESLANDPTLIAIRELLVSAGVPNERVLIEAETLSLIETTDKIQQLLDEAGYDFQQNSVILIAPALTMSRAVATFASRDIRTLPQPTDQFAFQIDDEQLVAAVSDLLPNVDALALTTRVVDEYLTSVYYYLRGWLAEPIVF